jgi:hypothetical protein
VDAESHEEAEADLDDVVQVVVGAFDVDEDLIGGFASGAGGRDVDGLIAEIGAHQATYRDD